MYATTIHTDAGTSFAGSGFDRALGVLTEGRRGLIATRLAIGMGLSDDPAALEAAYAANPSAVNAWWNEISPAKLAALTGESTASLAEVALSRRPALVFGVGILAGALVAHLIKR